MLAGCQTGMSEMTQDEIRDHFAASTSVHIQVATAEDGSPEMAWGDSFFFIRHKGDEPAKMSFATIVTKDYEGFDSYSQLHRGGLYRLNIQVGAGKFEQLLGFKPVALAQSRHKFDFTAIDQIFPHPTYGEYGWVSIVNPADQSRESVVALLDFSLGRALGKITPPTGH
jgi:hypothetical protein